MSSQPQTDAALPGQLELFGGATYDAERDRERLSKQLIAVRDFMSDGRWHYLYEIAYGTGQPEASISARLRDLRKWRFGGHTVDKRYVVNGLWEYRLTLKGSTDV